MNLTKEAKDFYKENYTLKKEIDKNVRKFKDVPSSWINGISIVKLSAIPIKIPTP